LLLISQVKDGSWFKEAAPSGTNLSALVVVALDISGGFSAVALKAKRAKVVEAIRAAVAEGHLVVDIKNRAQDPVAFVTGVALGSGNL